MNTEDIRNYILADKGSFTLTSLVTGNSFTYRRWDSNGFKGISVLTGPDNENDYTYIGVLWTNPEKSLLRVRATKSSKVSTSFKALNWFLRNLDHEQLFDKIEFRHEGRCCRCGRKLTTPESIDRGIGPVCAGREA